LKKFNLIQVIHFLPVFFFVLAISPNINSGRIGLVLVAVFLLIIPSANYVAANPERKILSQRDTKYSFLDFLSLVMVIAAFYLGWLISWQFNILQGLYLFSVVLISRKETSLLVGFKWLIARVIQGVLLFGIIYLGLNQYGFDNLLRIHILLFASLSTIIIMTSLYISNLREYYQLNQADEENRTSPINIMLLLIGLLFLAYAVFFTTTYHWCYAVYFTLAVLPAGLICISLLRKIQLRKAVNLPVNVYWVNIILALSLVIFFIYFFLESTQVLQAIRGGY